MNMLHIAAKLGLRDQVVALLKLGADPNGIDEEDCRPLHYAASEGHADIAADLIAAGADVNLHQYDSYNGPTPLCLAAARGHLAVIEHLLLARVVKDYECACHNHMGLAPILLAALNRHFHVVQRLVEAGTSLRETCRPRLSPPPPEAKPNLLEQLYPASDNTTSTLLHMKTLAGFTPLHAAAAWGDAAAVQYILCCGLHVDVGFDRLAGITPLHIAVKYGHAQIVRTLLYAYASSEKECAWALDRPVPTRHPSIDMGWRQVKALHLAALEGHLDIVIQLVTADFQAGEGLHSMAELSYPGPAGIIPMAGTAMHLACRAGHVDIVQCLAQGNLFRIEMKNPTGMRPVHIAALYGRLNVLKFLHQAGADLHATCTLPNVFKPRSTGRRIRGVTAMHLAALSGSVETTGYLRAAGVDVNARTVRLLPNNNDNTEGGGNFDEPNSPDIAENMGHTPLHFAAITGDVNIIRHLVAWGCNVEAMTLEGTPLVYAATLGTVASCSAMLAAGATPNAQNFASQAPLHYAALSRTSDTVEKIKVLVAGGAKVNARDWEGKTPLHVAVAGLDGQSCETMINCTVISGLLAAGADPLARDNEDETALEKIEFPILAGAPGNNLFQNFDSPIRAEYRRQVFHTTAALVAAGDYNWEALPRPCPHLERALPAVWENALHELQHLFALLEEAKKEEIQTGLRVLQRRVGVKDLQMNIVKAGCLLD